MTDAPFHDAFAGWLLDGDATRDPVPGVDPVRLWVHRNTFVVTLVDALVESFPTCVALLGVDYFRDLARAFVLAAPPRSPVVSEYMFGFPGFVAHWSPLAATLFLADVATLEAARIRAFHAADAEPLDAAAFAPLVADPARLASTRVALHPAAQWWRAPSPARDLWAAHQVDVGTHVDLSAIDVRQPQDVLVSRPGLVVEVATLPPGAPAFLDALRAGATLPEAFAAAQVDDAGADAGALFGLLIARGLAIALFDATPPADHSSPAQDPT